MSLSRGYSCLIRAVSSSGHHQKRTDVTMRGSFAGREVLHADERDKYKRRDSVTMSAVLPLYQRTVRFLSDPYMRMKKRALIVLVAALLVLYVLFVGFSSRDTVAPKDVVIHNRPGFQAPTVNHEGGVVNDVLGEDGKKLGGLRGDGGQGDSEVIPGAPPQPVVAAVPPREKKDDRKQKREAEDEDAEDDGVVPEGAKDPHAQKEEEEPVAPATPASQLPYFVRLVLPLLAGFCFGFLGSVPIAGPTSAMVLKLGIQGKYQAALTIAFGGAISEATYAGIAFWGFGSFLAGAKWLMPVSKVLGAIMFTIVGLIFLRSEVKSPLDVDASGGTHKGMRAKAARDEILKNVLMGLTMSGINPALLATYTGAIASVYGTGLLEFTLFLAFVFGIGVCCGVSTWFFILLSLLQKYKQSLKKQTIGYIMRGMGCFLLTLGAFCAKSSIEYFVWGVADTKP